MGRLCLRPNGQHADDCYNGTADGVHVPDLNATILHCLGVDPQRLTFRFQGLDQRLTGGQPAKVVEAILS